MRSPGSGMCVLQGRQEPLADVGGGAGGDALRLRLLHVLELLQQILGREDAVGVRRLHASAARVGVRDVDRRRLDRIGEQRQRPRRAPVARLAIGVPVDRRARLGNRLPARPRQAHGHDLVVHSEVDGSHARTVTRPAERQVAPLVRLDRPDRAVLIEPVRVRLVAERDPGREDAPPARLRTGLAHARDHEAEAVGDRAVRLPRQIGHLAVAPGVGLHDLAHRCSSVRRSRPSWSRSSPRGPRCLLRAHAGLLEAAERHLDVDGHAVDRDAARAHPARELVGSLRIRAVDGAVQAVDRVVGLGDGVVGAVVLDEADDRPEDLLLRDRHAAVDVVEHRRLDEVPARQVVGPPAARHDAGALVDALCDVALHAVELARHGQRPHLRRSVERIADLDGAHRIDVGLEHLALATGRHEHAGQREAHLPGDRHRERHEAREHVADLGVLEDHRGRLATELQAHARESLGGRRGDLAAGDRAAREGDLVDAGMADEVVADLAARGHDVEHARREARGLDALAEDVRVGRRLGCRLGDDRAAGGQRGRDLVAEQHHRGVPRGDGRDDTDRLPHDANERAVVARALVDDRIVLDQVGVELEEPRVLRPRRSS